MSFRILVACKRVVDYAIKVSPSNYNSTSLKHSLNPFDEIAIEEALRLKENGSNDTQVIALTIGGNKSGELLRTALALGADRGIHVNLEEAEGIYKTSSRLIAECITKICQMEEIKILLLGKQAIDHDSGIIGPMCASMLNWPQAISASKVQFNDPNQTSIKVTKEVDSGLQTIESSLPIVITTDLRLNTPRYATLQNIIKAKSKPVTKYELKDLIINLPPTSTTSDLANQDLILEKIDEPEKRKAGIILQNVDELIVKLKEKGLLKAK